MDLLHQKAAAARNIQICAAMAFLVTKLHGAVMEYSKAERATGLVIVVLVQPVGKAVVAWATSITQPHNTALIMV